MQDSNHRRNPPVRHAGAHRSSPYPVSRLAPSFGLVDLAQELEQADQVITSRLGGQLQVIAEQVRSLQAQAREILEAAREDQRLHRARCAFKRIPGKVYHLYEDADGIPAFSMLSPEDWNGRPPKPYLGAYRLEPDLSWTPAGHAEPGDDSRLLVQRLLAADTDLNRAPRDGA